MDSTEAPSQFFCTAQTSRGTQCHRPVNAGQMYCWQHAAGMKAKWRALTRNQSIAFIVAVFGVLITAIAWIFPHMWESQSDKSVTQDIVKPFSEPKRGQALERSQYEIYVKSEILPVEISCDGIVWGTLDNPPYTTIDVEEGHHVISAKFMGHVVFEKRISVGGNERSYIVTIPKGN